MFPEERSKSAAGQSAFFQCRVVAGIPTPEVEWARADGAQMADNTEILPGGAIR